MLTARGRAAFVAIALLLHGCVLVPRTVVRYDPGCRVAVRRMELQPVQIAAIGGCSNQGCALLVAAAAVTAAASAVVSGSITLAGNVVYWLEEQGACRRQE
jgi:hypothetical protein